jgi:hypothetical protein
VLLAVASTLAAGIWASLRDRDRGTAVRAGLFAGLASGVVVFLVATTMTLATLPTLASRSDYQQQREGLRLVSSAPLLWRWVVDETVRAASETSARKGR